MIGVALGVGVGVGVSVGVTGVGVGVGVRVGVGVSVGGADVSVGTWDPSPYSLRTQTRQLAELMTSITQAQTCGRTPIALPS